ncbi:unnamed protein product [Lactuca virosa]|uniref:Uncharacterized protein n=1 Tax=Lactuca virosa TaxID=75947 RepID=A0AAU9ME00_9ASTR|nr:unnamed protein product [Lactuca virosa]
MASSANVHDFTGDCDDGISDNESLDATLKDEIAGGMNITQNDEFHNFLCDNGKLSNSFAETLGHKEESGGSQSIPEADDDEEEIEYEFPVHKPKTKWSLMKPIEKEIYESPQQLKFALTNFVVANGYPL